MTDMSGGAFYGADESVAIAVVVVTFNSENEIPALLNSLRDEATRHRLRVIVVDNGSSDRTVELLRNQPDVITICTGANLGYAGGINAAKAETGDADAILILNPDLQVRPGAIGSLLNAARRHPRAGVIAPRIVDDHGRTTFSLSNEPRVSRALVDALLGPIWSRRPALFSEWVRSPHSYEGSRSADWVTGAAMLIPRAVAEHVGAWDERFFLYSEETDFCRRVRDAGFEVRYEPGAVVQHSQGKSGSSAELDALRAVNRVRYMRKHAPRRAAAYRIVAWLGAALRSRGSASQRLSAAMLRDEHRWVNLPRADERNAVSSALAPGTFAHVVLTRFNLPSKGYESLVRAKEGWLRSRVELFERFCLPSMRAQTADNHTWIIYFDPESPEWLKEWIERTNHGDFLPIFRAEVPHKDLLNDIEVAAGGVFDTLITTNLDNDDALANDFLERVVAAATVGARTAIYLADGLIGSGTAVYHRVDVDNAFCSVAEPWGLSPEPPLACWARAHNRLAEAMPVRSLRGRPAWLQVIHGSNVSNRVRGRLAVFSEHRDLFASLLIDYCQPTPAALAKDQLLEIPIRVLRETVRATAKWILVLVSGQERLDYLKERAARLTTHK